MPSRPRRILIVRPDRVGDVIISSSCLPAVRATFPDAEICLGARAAMQPLFENHPLLSGFVPLPSPALPFLTRFGALCSTLKEPRFDWVISLHPDPAFYLAAWRIGVPRRIGYLLPGLSWTLTERIAERRRECRMHEGAYNFDLLQPLGVPRPEDPGSLRASVTLPEAARESLRGKLAQFARGLSLRYFCLHLGAFSPLVRWPVSHFVELGRWLRESYGADLVLIGHDATDHSHRDFHALAATAGLPFHDLAGRLDLAELGWLFRDALCLIGRDSGPSHLAASVGCPMVVLFGRLDSPYGPTRWAPFGERVRVVATPAVRQPKEARNDFFLRAFHEITVERVAAAVGELC